MIEFVKGQVVDIAHHYVVVEVRGIGYRVFCPYPAKLKPGEEACLYTHHHVREDAVQLYGFATREEREVFEMLIEVSGIGPKGALGILSVARPEELLRAIDAEDLASLTKLPGVGKKTAQRLVIDLKEKVKGLGIWYRAKGDARQEENGERAAFPPETDHHSAGLLKDALLSLGYSEKEAVQAIAACERELAAGAPVDQLLRKALRALA